jgi:integrase
VLWPTALPKFVPHIFTVEELRQTLQGALNLRPRGSNTQRPRTFFTLLLVLYATGLRISEAQALRIGDVNLEDGTLLIRESKFFKARVVPVSDDLRTNLRDYLARLDVPRTNAAATSPLFQKGRGRGYSLAGLQTAGTQILRDAGVKPRSGRVGPRLHDLRHTFAVRCIERWYADGSDVQNLLPRLATYMGHGDISATLHYITITQEILGRAGDRFERACSPGRRQ